MTKLPSKELLQRQLHKGLEAARQRWEDRQENRPLKITLPNKKRFVSLQNVIVLFMWIKK